MATEATPSGAGGGAGVTSTSAASGDVHPLQNKWTLFELRARQNKESYMDQHYPLFTADTVEDFWKNFVHVPEPSKMFYSREQPDKPAIKRFDKDAGKDRVSVVEGYVLFKSHIQPTLECILPGKGKATTSQLRCRMVPRSTRDWNMYDKAWTVIILGLIGEVFDEFDNINGVRLVDKVVGRKAQVRFEVWLHNDNQWREIAKRIQEAVDFATRGSRAGLKLSFSLK